MDDNAASRGNFLYASQSIGGNYGRANHDPLQINSSTTFHLHHQSGGDHCFQTTSGAASIVKTEASTSHQHVVQKFHHYPSLMSTRDHHHQTVHQQPHDQTLPENDRSKEVEAIKSKIIAHPQYSNLLGAYMDCQKVLCVFVYILHIYMYVYIKLPI